jgi:glycine/D-amino acid oxidase-like deaminating enzyme
VVQQEITIMSHERHSSERVVIVGGGFAGLSIAARLAQAGLSVTLLEATKLGFEASSRNQGWLYSGAWFAPDQPELARSCFASLQQTVSFCPQCLEPGHRGMLYFVSHADTQAKRWTAAWEAAGIPFEAVPSDQLRRQLPRLDLVPVRQAFLLPDRAFRPQVLLDHLAAAARNAGAEIRTDTPVTRLLRSDRSVEGIVTGRGEEISARLVVLATGALIGRYWSEVLTPTAGGQPGYMRVVLKTHLIAVRPELGRVPFCVVDEDGFNHIPHAETSVFGINRWSVVTDPGDQQVQPEEVEHIWRLAKQFFPYLDRSRCDEIVQWAGTTLQALRVDQAEPAQAALPTIIDHRDESPRLDHLWSVYPGRATLWAELAEQARQKAFDELGVGAAPAASPPWAV